jgi:hypothetical protein
MPKGDECCNEEVQTSKSEAASGGLRVPNTGYIKCTASAWMGENHRDPRELRAAMPAHGTGEEALELCERSQLLAVLTLGPVLESVRRHLNSKEQITLTQVCKAMRKEASQGFKIKPCPWFLVATP